MNHLKKVKKYLKSHDIAFEVIRHAEAFTAAEIAASQHIPGKQMLKPVIVKGDHGYAMCVLTATQHLDFDLLETSMGKEHWVLATEEEVAELFPECETGAEPPFGEWHNLPVFADRLIEQDADIYFNAGTHTETMKLKREDWEELSHPKWVSIGTHI